MLGESRQCGWCLEKEKIMMNNLLIILCFTAFS